MVGSAALIDREANAVYYLALQIVNEKISLASRPLIVHILGIKKKNFRFITRAPIKKNWIWLINWAQIIKKNLKIFFLFFPDVNDNAPEFSERQYFAEIGENWPIGASVLKIFAIDRDDGENGNVSFKKIGGDRKKIFLSNQ